jgi:hypothetical protein
LDEALVCAQAEKWALTRSAHATARYVEQVLIGGQPFIANLQCQVEDSSDAPRVDAGAVGPSVAYRRV